MSDLQLLALAQQIDAERASALGRRLGAREGAALGVLLGSAYPSLDPEAPAIAAALRKIAREGLSAARTRRGMLERLAESLAPQQESERWVGELRRAVWVEKVRIALREVLPSGLGGADLPETAGELSALADAVLELTLAEASRHVAARFGHPQKPDGSRAQLLALGMGKLGGFELNAGSDIDLVFVYDSDEASAGLSPHEFFTRVVRRAVAHIETPGDDGLIFRVDLRLRPEGSRGPLVNSLSAFERYYESWGRLWERAAMLRARPAAGSVALGAEVEREVLSPFSYRREVEPAIALALSEQLLQSRNQLSSQPARDLKLGLGGIREAEFFVQALQLIWGGREPSLRVRGTLPALSRLRLRGFVSDREARGIARAYVLLRRVEHAVQWSTGRQTHQLPTDAEELTRLARVVGFETSAALESELASLRELVHESFSALTPGAPSKQRRYGNLVALLRDEADAEELAQAASALFASGDVPEHLHALGRRPDGLLGSLTHERYPDLAERVLGGLSESSNPERAARFLRWIFARLSAPGAYVDALAQDPRALARLVTVLASSAFVGDAIVARPELLDAVLFGQGSVSDVRAALAHQLEDLARYSDDGDAEERAHAWVGALRHVKSRIMVEIAIADLGGSESLRRTTATLSLLAEEIVQAVVRFQLGQARGFCVLSLGKLGGRELGYGSDLDLLFLYDPDFAPNPDEASAFFSSQAQRIMRRLSEPHEAGPGYVLDTRLRPSGSHGMLVASISAFAAYHGVHGPAERARPRPVVLSGAAWERQALIRARFCAGDAELGARATRLAEVAAYTGGAPAAAELHRLRLRMERELGKERAGRYDLKLGEGGLYDIEFVTQWLQMTNGHDLQVRTPDTTEALDALTRRGYLPRVDYEVLRDAYGFLRRLEQRIHVHRGDSSNVVDARSPGLSELGRRNGFQDRAGATAGVQLLERYRNVTRAVRASYLQLLGLGALDAKER